jgi:hypothetical protein
VFDGSHESHATSLNTESMSSGTLERFAKAAFNANDVRAALNDIWRSHSLSELKDYLHPNDGISDTISSLERFLCTQERYTAHVDTFQSARFFLTPFTILCFETPSDSMTPLICCSLSSLLCK